MTAILENIQFGILSDKDILAQSVCEISNTKLSGVSSIYDERMGVLENAKFCVTCTKNNKECIGHFGHIKLNVSVAHPLFYKSILSVLRCLCYRCSRIRMSKEQFEFHGLLKYQKQSRFIKVLKMLEKMDTCLLCDTLQPKYVLSTTDKSISMIFKIEGEARKNILYDYEIKKIFQNMIESDVELLGFDPKHSHPKNLIIDILPVLPPVARPYIISDNVTCDDDLTIQYLEIIKANTHLMVDSSCINEMKRQRYMQSLKFRIKCLFDNSQERSKHSNGRPLKGIKKRLTGKEGQLRNNLMGKRVDKSARTVIGPDPTLKVNEIAIPYEIADTLTYPVKVTKMNIDELTVLLHNHKINYVIRKDSTQRINMKYALYRQRSKLQFGDYLRKRSGEYIFIKNEKQFFLLEPEDAVIRNGKVLHDFEHATLKHFFLEIGDTVERKLQDGDVLLLNRQPTLHKGSMIAFNCKLRKGKTIRTNLAITKSFNADFDGDEMNLHAPNSVETETELRLLSSVQNHIISNQSNKPNIVIVQDGLLAAYVMTGYDHSIPRHQFMNILLSIGESNPDMATLLQKKQKLFAEKCPHLPDYSGKLLFSFLFPDNFFYRHGDVEVEEGILKSGRITKTQLSSSHHSFIAIFYHMYGSERCEQLINEVQFLGNEFLKYHGFSIGLEDCMIPKEAEDKMTFSIQKHFVETQLHYDSIRTPHILEMSISNILSNTRNTCMKIAKDYLPETNNFLSTVTSGSKGDYFNITQIMAMLGQQNFQGQRIQSTMSNNRRSLPHFPLEEKDMNDPLTKFRSQGFIRSSFLKGLDPTEFFFHAITGREGITDTAMKSVTWETPVILLRDGLCVYTPIGKWIDEALQQRPQDVKRYPEREMEMMDVQGIYIPTTDYQGHVSWANVASITRHDPGIQLYNVKTKSGRTVTVTESKSLLVWNHQTREFKEMLTPEIQVGDFVPVTLNLGPPPIIQQSIPLQTHLQNVLSIEKKIVQESLKRMVNTFELDYDNGLFVGIFMALGSFSERHHLRVRTLKHPFVHSIVERWFQKYSVTVIHPPEEEREGRSSIDGHSTVMTHFLKSFIGVSIKDFHVPDESFASSEDFIKGILSGYFSANGRIGTDSIRTISSSYRLVEGLNMLCSRLGVLGGISVLTLFSQNNHVHKQYALHLKGEWAASFSSLVTLVDEIKDRVMKDRKWCTSTCKYDVLNDVALDRIVEISHVDVKDHPKVYDLTVPSTFNFGLANGLQVRDTATSGYIQRRMVKVAEDVQVKYDDTVRNSAGSILQFRYGYNSYDPSQSVIVKDEEGVPTNFFTDVGELITQMNYDHTKKEDVEV